MNILLAIALLFSTPTLEVYENVDMGMWMPRCTIVKNSENDACVYIYHTPDGPLVVTYNAERK